ncbi:MAG TPA: PQQ-dependent sugar dehydrogenase [Polyangiaceae bacterium]|jgi:MYXO-CTERM domain-containing protein|nr:PQQ-dependent sugar dehydrogenase [Polyangiaceae bacterium]
MRAIGIASAFCVLLASHSAWADYLADGPPSDTLDYDDEWLTGLEEPTGMAFLPDGRLVITQRAGDVVVRTTDGALVTAGHIEVSTGFQEKGLLNVAVHPDYATNHIIFLYYTGTGGSEDDNRVVSIELSDDNVLNLDTEKHFVDGIAAPLNHDGGGLAIDGKYLYIGTGDSGHNTNAEPKDMQVNNYFATCMTALNGKILRLNLDGSIPDDNPLVGKSATECNSWDTAPSGVTDMPRKEIFAWGFRNAFRVWADPKSHNLWVGHVGEVTYEMISVVPPTGAVHMGWPFREGNEGYPASKCQEFEPNVGDCKLSAYRCESSDGNPGSEDYNPDVPDNCDSITGGLILNSCVWPDSLEGQYIFGDYQSEMLWTLQINDTRDDVIAERVDFGGTQGGGPVAFVEHEGALYLAVHSKMGGHVTKITPKTPDAPCDGEMMTPGPTTPTPDGDGGTATPEPTSTEPSTSGPGDSGSMQPGNGGASSTPTPAPTETTGPGGTMTPSQPGPGSDNPGGTPETPGAGPGGSTEPPGNGPVPTTTTPAGPANSSGGPGNPTGNNGPNSGADAGSGVTQEAGDNSDKSGCGCRTVGSEHRSDGSSAALGLLALGVVAMRRRRW